MSDELIMKNTILDWTPKVLRVNLMLYLIIGWGKELLPEWLPLIWGEASNKYCEHKSLYGAKDWKYWQGGSYSPFSSRILWLWKISLVYSVASRGPSSMRWGRIRRTFIWRKHPVGQVPCFLVECLGLQFVSSNSNWGWVCELLVTKLDSENLQPLLESWLVVYIELLNWIISFCPSVPCQQKILSQRVNTKIFCKEIIPAGMEKPVGNPSLWPTISNRHTGCWEDPVLPKLLKSKQNSKACTGYKNPKLLWTLSRFCLCAYEFSLHGWKNRHFNGY